MIEDRRTVIIFDYANSDVMQLVHTEIRAEERDTLVRLDGRDIYYDRNVVYDDFHELT